MLVRCSSRLHRKQAPLGIHSKKVIIVLTKKDLQSLSCCVQSGGSQLSLMMLNVNPSGSYRVGIRSTGGESRNTEKVEKTKGRKIN